MEEITKEGVNLTLADEIEQQKFDKGNLLAMVSISFDMGCNKRPK